MDLSSAPGHRQGRKPEGHEHSMCPGSCVRHYSDRMWMADAPAHSSGACAARSPRTREIVRRACGEDSVRVPRGHPTFSPLAHPHLPALASMRPQRIRSAPPPCAASARALTPSGSLRRQPRPVRRSCTSPPSPCARASPRPASRRVASRPRSSRRSGRRTCQTRGVPPAGSRPRTSRRCRVVAAPPQTCRCRTGSR